MYTKMAKIYKKFYKSDSEKIVKLLQIWGDYDIIIRLDVR
jgi:hypothetical protein